MDASESRHEQHKDHRRVLVLGKGADINGATRKYLEFCGHTVCRSKGARNAVGEADEMKPHVVVCELDRRSGAERATAVRRIQEAHDAMVVLVTNFHRGEVTHRFPRLEVDAFLRKPISLSRLERTVADA